jgi:metal-responsive CopG/Arc/MetJ family transcriptional regulator
MKTAVSIQKSLFEQAEMMARKMKISRSRLVSLALEDYIGREQNRELLTRINAAFENEPDSTEKTLRLKSRGTHRRIVKGEW